MNTVREVGTYETKTHLSKLIEEVEAGGKILITRHGKVVAELHAPSKEIPQAQRGCAYSKDFYMSDDFDEPLEDFKDYM